MTGFEEPLRNKMCIFETINKNFEDEIEHDENVTQWDVYRSEILPIIGTAYPDSDRDKL
jgi:hypothetical protein